MVSRALGRSAIFCEARLLRSQRHFAQSDIIEYASLLQPVIKYPAAPVAPVVRWRP